MEQIAAYTLNIAFIIACVLVTLGFILAFTEFAVKTVKDTIWQWRRR